MNTYRIHADYSGTRRTITYRSPKTLQELKTGLLSDTYTGNICYLFDNEREEPVDSYGINLSRADTVTIYLVGTDEPTGDIK